MDTDRTTFTPDQETLETRTFSPYSWPHISPTQENNSNFSFSHDHFVIAGAAPLLVPLEAAAPTTLTAWSSLGAKIPLAPAANNTLWYATATEATGATGTSLLAFCGLAVITATVSYALGAGIRYVYDRRYDIADWWKEFTYEPIDMEFYAKKFEEEEAAGMRNGQSLDAETDGIIRRGLMIGTDGRDINEVARRLAERQKLHRRLIELWNQIRQLLSVNKNNPMIRYYLTQMDDLQTEFSTRWSGLPQTLKISASAASASSGSSPATTHTEPHTVEGLAIAFVHISGLEQLPLPEQGRAYRQIQQQAAVIAAPNGLFIKNMNGEDLLIVAGTQGNQTAQQNIQQLMRALEQLRAQIHATRPDTRLAIGVHVGEALWGEWQGIERWEWDVMGRAINLAARAESTAVRRSSEIGRRSSTETPQDQIVISQPVKEALRPRYVDSLTDLGPQTFKGVSDQHNVYLLTSPTPSSEIVTTEMVSIVDVRTADVGRVETVIVIAADVTGSTATADSGGDVAAAHLANRFMEELRLTLARLGINLEAGRRGDEVILRFNPLDLEAVLRAFHNILARLLEEDPTFQIKVGIAQGEAIRYDDGFFVSPAIDAARRAQGAAGTHGMAVDPGLFERFTSLGLAIPADTTAALRIKTLPPSTGFVRTERFIPAERQTDADTLRALYNASAVDRQLRAITLAGPRSAGKATALAAFLSGLQREAVPFGVTHGSGADPLRDALQRHVANLHWGSLDTEALRRFTQNTNVWNELNRELLADYLGIALPSEHSGGYTNLSQNYPEYRSALNRVVAQAVAQIATSTTPLIVVLFDTDRMAATARQTLSTVLDQNRTLSILIIGFVDTVAGTVLEPVVTVEAQTAGVAEDRRITITFQPLSTNSLHQAQAEIWNSLHPHETSLTTANIPETVLDSYARRSQGDLGRMRLLMGDDVQREVLTIHDGQLALAQTTEASSDPMRDVWQRRFDALSHPAQQAANEVCVVAQFDGTFTTTDLPMSVPTERTQLLRALAELRSAGLIVDGPTADSYAIIEPDFLQFLYNARLQTGVTEAAIHTPIANHLAAIGLTLPHNYALLGFHQVLAGHHVQGIASLNQAIQMARFPSLTEWEQFISTLERLCNDSRIMLSIELRNRVRVYAIVQRALFTQTVNYGGNRSLAATFLDSHWNTATQALQRLNDHALEIDFLSTAMRIYAVAGRTDRTTDIHALLINALTLDSTDPFSITTGLLQIEDVFDRSELARKLAAQDVTTTGHFERALRLITIAEQGYRDLGNPDRLCWCGVIRMVALNSLGRFDESLAVVDKLSSDLTSVTLENTAYLRINRVVALLRQGRPADANADIQYLQGLLQSNEKFSASAKGRVQAITALQQILSNDLDAAQLSLSIFEKEGPSLTDDAYVPYHLAHALLEAHMEKTTAAEAHIDALTGLTDFVEDWNAEVSWLRSHRTDLLTCDVSDAPYVIRRVIESLRSAEQPAPFK